MSSLSGFAREASSHGCLYSHFYSELANYFPYDQAKAIGPTRKGTGAAPPMNGSLPMGMMSAGGKGIGLNFDHVLAKLQVLVWGICTFCLATLIDIYNIIYRRNSRRAKKLVLNCKT